MQCKYRTVLSIDGGGIRGVIPLTILDYIQTYCQKEALCKNWLKWIDVFAGTSTGAIISGALMSTDTAGNSIYSPSIVLDLYKKRGKQIFSVEQLKPKETKALYPLRFVLEQNFGKLLIQDAIKHFLFVSYDLNAESPFIFTDTMERYRNLPLSKVMLACSAVPQYFPPIELGDKLLADGMLTAKNPSKLAYQYARMHYPDDPIIVLSLGTGTLEETNLDSIEEQCLNTHKEMEQLAIQERNLIYFRFQPTINAGVLDIADSSKSNISNLEKIAKDYISQQSNSFNRLFKLMQIRAERYR